MARVRFINEDAYHGRIGCALVKQTFPVYLILNVGLCGLQTASWFQAPVAGYWQTLDELGLSCYLRAHWAATVDTIIAPWMFRKTRYFTSVAGLSIWMARSLVLNCTPVMALFSLPTGCLDTTVDGEVLNNEGAIINGLNATSEPPAGTEMMATRHR